MDKLKLLTKMEGIQMNIFVRGLDSYEGYQTQILNKVFEIFKEKFKDDFNFVD